MLWEIAVYSGPMDTTTNSATASTTEKPLAVGDGMTLLAYNDSYPFVIVELSASGKTAKVRALKIVSASTGHKPARIEGGFPIWSHSYTAEERASMIVEENDDEGNEVEARTVRLTKNGWTSQGTRFSATGARYHRNCAAN